VREHDPCDGCGKITETIHSRCANCWYEKRPDLTLRRAPEPRSWPQSLADAALDPAWLFPGTALAVIALLVGGEEVLVVIGVLLLLSGGALKFGDFTPW